MEFDELLKRISPKLKGIVFKLNSFSLLADYDDLLQESFSHLWGEFSAGKLSDKTDSYILQGCYFHLKNYLRLASVSHRTVSLDEINTEEGDSYEERTFCIHKSASGDLRDSLNSKLFAETIRNDGLTSREKDILFLFAEGLTTRDIGRRVNLSHVRVVKLLKAIKEKCRKYLDKL